MAGLAYAARCGPSQAAPRQPPIMRYVMEPYEAAVSGCFSMAE